MTLPHGWIETNIGEIGELIRGVTYKKQDTCMTAFNSCFPILRANNITNSSLEFEDLVYIPEKYVADEQLIRQNDIIICMSSGSKSLVGKAAIAAEDLPMSFGAFCGLLRISNDINKKYISLLMQSINYRKHIESLTKGTNINNLKHEHIFSFSIPLPPLPEQHRIVAKIDALFSELDNGVAFLKTIKAQLATYRQAVLKWAFEGKLTTEWRKANDVENQEVVIKNIMIAREMEICKEKYKNIEPEFPLYDLPKEWKWVSIGCISKGVEYGTSAKSNKNGKVVVLRMGNIQNGTFVYDDLAYTSNKKEIEKYKLNEGDVLFNRTNSPELVGKTAIYIGSVPSIFAGYLIRLNQISYIDAKYLNYYLNSPHSKKCGNIAKTDGVNQSNINGTKLSTYPFPLCSKPEQLAIVSAIESRLSVCDKLEQTIDQTLALSVSLRQSILKKAFEGRLVPQDPNDEPAEKLLERIKAEKVAVLVKQKQTRKRGRK
jgi:type I restriction enzyme S subunit